MVEGDVFSVPDETPKGKRKIEKAEVIPKVRVHIYIAHDTLEQVDYAAHELRLSRSTVLQLVIRKGLNDFEGWLSKQDFIKK
jgi:hypothetical protein|tara:strand:+ start:294 stop:539 length:246 start_codon:yes stop_codon:yes gene_type:complete